eukprot:6225709-Amphidinium_carterae.1
MGQYGVAYWISGNLNTFGCLEKDVVPASLKSQLRNVCINHPVNCPAFKGEWGGPQCETPPPELEHHTAKQILPCKRCQSHATTGQGSSAGELLSSP